MARILVTGATGFIGKRLVGALVEAGHDVKAMTRHPETYDGPGRPVRGDVGERASLTEPLEDVDVAYYLVHSLDNADFEERDADAARMFAKVAEKTGVEQIVYLGGLGNERNGALSAHLRSRREVEGLLGSTGIPVTVLRAAIVVGKGGISWEMTRQLVK
ncbi:MAG TPA: NAD(P)H-binding protein, partial [Marmoricola sp.]|nr:NAD(P)H-binding protein [Marmoricola sp.]